MLHFNYKINGYKYSIPDTQFITLFTDKMFQMLT